jgi:hypothetical protein
MPTPSRLRVPQLELFRPSPITPAISPDVYRTTVQLLARLLREHAQKAGANPAPAGRRAMSDKVQAQHVARKAMLYVRQSSAYQVTHRASVGELAVPRSPLGGTRVRPDRADRECEHGTHDGRHDVGSFRRRGDYSRRTV